MRRWISSGVAVMLVAACSQAAVAGVINVATGLDASNNLITTGGTNDGHWTVDLPAGGTGPAQVVTSSSADWFSGWMADGPNSAWLARNAGLQDNGSAPYTFHTFFDLSGYNLSTVSLSGGWAIDDSGTLRLNGTQISTLSNGFWGSLNGFSVATGSALFVQGLNELSITIDSSDHAFEAVRLEGTVSGTNVPAAPEPSSLLLAASGVVALFGISRRRRLMV